MQNWFDHILYHTRAQPEMPAIVMEDRAVTYGMLKTGADRCARRVANLGLTGDAPVAVLVENQIRHLTLCLALLWAGIPSISLVDSQLVITDMKFVAVLGDEAAKAVVGPGHRFIEITDDWFATDLVGGHPPTAFSDSLQICRVNLTSGTTGEPKIVKFTIADIGCRIDALIRFNWNKLLCLPGLASSWGFWTACATLAAGGTLYFSASPFQSIRMIELFSIDYVMASTEQLLALTRTARKSGAHLASLHIVETGGTMVTRALLENATMFVCKDVYCRYGASEAGAMARAPARDVISRPGFAGHVLPGVEMAVVDSSGKVCLPGEVGTIRSRRDPCSGVPTPSGKAENTSWVDLGDLGWMSADGELYVLGRSAEVAALNSQDISAHQISPIHEVEHLFRLEWDATDAAAILASDRVDRTKPQIWVGHVDCKDANAEQFETLIRSKGFDYAIRLFPMPRIPRGVNGKVNRLKLKASMLASAGQVHSS
jgi:acyl-CoA synthetase (AMP-forming)/AMP-acid ligase II